MSATGLDVFDRTLQITNTWLNEIEQELGWSGRQRAYHALRAVLHALRDHMPVNDAAHLAAQLPLLLRGTFFDGWRPAATPVRERTLAEFVVHVADEFPFNAEIDPRRVVAAVFKVMAAHVTAGEVQKVKHLLPSSVQELWP